MKLDLEVVREVKKIYPITPVKPCSAKPPKGHIGMARKVRVHIKYEPMELELTNQRDKVSQEEDSLVESLKYTRL